MAEKLLDVVEIIDDDEFLRLRAERDGGAT